MMKSKKSNKQEEGTRFCPKCESRNITMRIPNAFSASIGTHPGWICKNCGLKLPEFPKEGANKI